MHDDILHYFAYTHLPLNLQEVSKPFCHLAERMVTLLHIASDQAEVHVGLRKLLEAKDCFVRAALTVHAQKE